MLEVDGLDVYHGDLQALWNISFHLGEGEIITLIGANGGGKTTAPNCINVGALYGLAAVGPYRNVMVGKAFRYPPTWSVMEAKEEAEKILMSNGFIVSGQPFSLSKK
jgi:ABC-type glutathione transport system ATPase component